MARCWDHRVREGLMSELGHSRRFWYVRSMSGQGLISEMPDVQFTG
jgi:hypothetical protein